MTGGVAVGPRVVTRMSPTDSTSTCSPCRLSPGLSVKTGNLGSARIAAVAEEKKDALTCPQPTSQYLTPGKRLFGNATSPSPSPLTPTIEALLWKIDLVDQAGCDLEVIEEEEDFSIKALRHALDSSPVVETPISTSACPQARSSGCRRYSDSSLSSGATSSDEGASDASPQKRDLKQPTISSAAPQPQGLHQQQQPRRRSRSNSHSELAKTAVGLREIARKIGRAQLIWDHQPKTVLLVTKIHDEQLVRITHQVAKWLVLEIGLTVLVEDRLEHDPAFGYSLLADELRSATDSDDSSPADKSQKIQFWTNEYCASAAGSAAVDFLITLGGDGTVLYAAWLFQQKCPPIIPFRLGSLGFLTTFDFASFRQSVRDLVLGPGLQKGLRMNFRIRFSCTILRHDPDAKHIGGNEADHGATFEILNDLTIDRGPSPFMSQLELYGNDNHLTTIHADGLTISTPTGSTAYSLSSGGSLVHPDVSAILVTPICPHTLSFRPMILPDTMEVRITVPEDSRATAFASFDGRKRVCLGRGDTVVVKAGVWPVPTVCWEDQSKDWFTGLERCLGWNKRERQKGLVGGGESGMEGIAW